MSYRNISVIIPARNYGAQEAQGNRLVFNDADTMAVLSKPL